MTQLLLAVLLLAPSEAPAAAEPCRGDCSGDVACEREAIGCLAGRGRERDAIERAKALVASRPGDPALARLLAGLYEDAGNRFWAQRTLHAALERHPDDCETRSWLAWLHVQEGDLDLAEERLSEPGCPASAEGRARWALIRAGILGAREDTKGRAAAVGEAGASEHMYSEDRPVWQALKRRDPGWLPPVELRLESLIGYTSNASAGLPLSKAGPERGGAFLRLDAVARFVWPLMSALKPSAEFSFRGQGVDDFDRDAEVDLREASYSEGSLRLGLYLGSGAPLRGFLGYRGDLFLLNQGDRYEDKPQLYHEGHRADGELELGGGLTLFGGGGRRTFRHLARSRWEVDGGLGWGGPLGTRVSLLVAAAGRFYAADTEEYTSHGGTALAVANVGLGAGLLARLGVSGGFDRYPDSPAGVGGRDILLRPSVVLWSPPWHGMRAGVGYELGWRDSTSEVSFSYTEHRTLLRLKYVLDAGPFGPAVAERASHVPLRWGISGPGGRGLDEERIQDLLRRDEGTRRGSSCAN